MYLWSSLPHRDNQAKPILSYLCGLLLEVTNNLSIFLDLGGHCTQCLQQEESAAVPKHNIHMLVLDTTHIFNQIYQCLRLGTLYAAIEYFK